MASNNDEVQELIVVYEVQNPTSLAESSFKNIKATMVSRPGQHLCGPTKCMGFLQLYCQEDRIHGDSLYVLGSLPWACDGEIHRTMTIYLVLLTCTCTYVWATIQYMWKITSSNFSGENKNTFWTWVILHLSPTVVANYNKMVAISWLG
jgi:hypothetical protein